MLKKIFQYRDTFFFISLVACIMVLPFSFRLNSISVVCLFVFWLFKDNWKQKLENAKRRKSFLFLFVSLYLIYVVGMLWTSNISFGLFELEKKSFLIVFPLILGTINRLTKEEIKKILHYFIISCAVLSVICLGYATYRVIINESFSETDPVSHYTTHYFFYFGLTDIFSLHPAYLSLYLVFSIFILLQESVNHWTSLSASKRILKSLVMIYFVVFLFFLAARIMILSFFVVFVIYLFYYCARRGKLLIGLSILTSLVLVALVTIYFTPVLKSRFAVFFNFSYSFVNDPETNKNLSGKLDDANMRFAKWYFTLEAGKDSWLAGVGTGDDQDALLNTYYKNNFMEGYVPKYNAHNQYLQTWLGLGVIGLLILVLNFVVPLYFAFTQKNVLYLIFLLLLIFFCCSETVFARQHGVAFYSFFNALLAFHTLRFNTR